MEKVTGQVTPHLQQSTFIFLTHRTLHFNDLSVFLQYIVVEMLM